MPDAPAPPAAPATPPSTTPNITFGGGTPAPPAPAKTPATPPEGGGAETTETTTAPEPPSKFEFKFDGDDEAYTFEESKPDDTEVAEQYDATKPFNPAIEELLKDHPEELKALKAGHYELRQLKAELQKAGFKSPKELKAYKSRIDALGGPEAIEKEAGEWATAWSGLAAGDPAVLEQFGTEHPEGMAKLSGPMLDWLHKTNPGVWAGHMSKVFMATLTKPNAQGMSALAAFNQLYDLEGIKGNAPAEKLLGQIAQVINDVHKASEGAEKVSSGANGDKRAQEFASKERGLYLKEVNMQAGPIVQSAARQAMKVALKGITISKEAEADILADIQRQFNSMQKADDVFQKNARDLLSKNDTDRFLKVLKSAIARNMPRAALREARKYKGLSGGNAQRKAEGAARTETAGGAAGQANRMRYTGPMKQGGPDPAQIAYSEMRARYGRKETDEMLSRHEFLKKGGDPKVIYFW